MEQWIEFYQEFFETEEETKDFVEELEALNRDSSSHRAKIMMHQAQRLVSLADEIVQIRPEKDSLQLMFLLIAAENLAKTYEGSNVEGKSRKYTRDFFINFLNQEQHNQLVTGFARTDSRHCSLEGVINKLYDVRCSVVHEGRYWDFHFACEYPLINAELNILSNLTYKQFRELVVLAAINAISCAASP